MKNNLILLNVAVKSLLIKIQYFEHNTIRTNTYSVWFVKSTALEFQSLFITQKTIRYVQISAIVTALQVAVSWYTNGHKRLAGIREGVLSVR
jgi:hypothetical protein